MNEKERPSQPEQPQPLAMTLSAETQKGLFTLLATHLYDATYREVTAGLDRESTRQVDGMRDVFIAIHENLNHESVPARLALAMGLTRVLSRDQLEEWANQPIATEGDQTGRYATFFLQKDLQDQPIAE